MSILVILSLLIGLPYTYTQISSHQIENEYPPLGYFETIDNIKLHYTDEGSGQTVVLLHSQPANERQFYLLKNQLKKNYRVISIDRPGMGYSENLKDKSSNRLMAQAELTSKLIQKITDDKPVVIGHSYGGALALEYALYDEKNIKGLITVNTASHPWKSDNIWLPFKIITSPFIGKIFSNTYAMIYGKLGISRTADENFPNNNPPINYIKNVGGELTLRPNTLQSYAYDAVNLKSALNIQYSKYSSLKIPITIIAGIGDRVTPNETHSFRLHEDVKHSLLIKVDGVEHSIPELRPDVIEDELLRILNM